MGEKTRVKIYTTLSQERLDRIDSEANELGLSRAAYARQRLEAGRLLFRCSGTMDVDLLRDLVEEGAESFDSTSERDVSELDSDIATTILAKLPADSSRAADKEEVHDMVFGTRKERMERIDEVMRELYDRGQVDSGYDGGYYTTDG